MSGTTNTQMPLPNGDTLLLKRHPLRANERLQAWDGADLHLLEQFHSKAADHSSKILVVNDNFGALTLGLIKYDLSIWGDSYIALQSGLANYQLNFNAKPSYKIFRSIRVSNPNFDLIAMKIPKNHDLFAAQLCELRTTISSKAEVFAAIMAKDLKKSLVEQLARLGFAVTVSEAYKKSRILRVGIANNPGHSEFNKDYSSYREFKIPPHNLIVKSLPGVFSAKKPDEGGLLLSSYIGESRSGIIIDIGCGNGLLSVPAAIQNPKATIVAIDDSYRAVESTKASFIANNISLQNHHFIVSNCLDGVDYQGDLILCNPPFHLGRSLDYTLAQRMFAAAKYALSEAGELLVVGNRHLNYHIHLKRYFARVKTISKHPKFVVFRCQH